MTSEAVPIYEPDEWSTPWLEHRAALSPDAPALEMADEVLSYAELALRSRLLAERLRETGIRDADVVAVLLPAGSRFVELVHAASMLGVVLVLLNTRLTASELGFQLADSGAGWLIHAAGELAERASEATASLRQLRCVELSAQPSPVESSGSESGLALPAPARIDPDRPLVILYTSGTTGRPKGVPLSLTNFLASAAGSAALLGLEAQRRWLLCMPLFHVGGLSILLRSTLAGTTVVLHDRFDPADVSAALDEQGITGVSLVANMLQRLLDARADAPAPASLKCVLLGGGPAPAPLLERAAAAGFPLAATYGLTEAASQVATCPPAVASDARVDGLQPLPGAEVRVVDAAGEPLAPGAEGEICVRGVMVMKGYWARPEQSREALRGGWLFTGDVGVLAEDGSLRVLDRRSDLIVSGGENVYPAEIETVLLEHPAVAEAGVAGAADARFGSRPVAWLVARPGTAIDLEAVRALCEQRLAGYKVPDRFHVVEALPRNATGKLLRVSLREP